MYYKACKYITYVYSKHNINNKLGLTLMNSTGLACCSYLLSICLSVCLYVCLSVCPPTSVYLSWRRQGYPDRIFHPKILRSVFLSFIWLVCRRIICEMAGQVAWKQRIVTAVYLLSPRHQKTKQQHFFACALRSISVVRKRSTVAQVVKGRLHELKKGLFSTPKLSDLLHTGQTLELKTGPF